jgi:hypothetical protein
MHHGLQAAATTPSQARKHVMWSKNISASGPVLQSAIKKRRQFSIEGSATKCGSAAAWRGHLGRKNALVWSSRNAFPCGSLLSNIRHDLTHLHGLAGRHLLNTEDDLVIRRAGRVLNQPPKALQ